MANTTTVNLQLTVQATGENAGTWGTITNTNLQILEQGISGYASVTVNGTGNTSLTFTNGALSNGKNQVLKLAGTITGNINVIISDSIEKTYVVYNATSGAHTVTFKTTSGSGVTWGTTDKGTKMVYSDGTNVIDTAFTELSSDISPQLSGNLDTNSNNIIIDDNHSIIDENNNEQITFQTTASAVNQFDITNAATGNPPEISATGGDTNIDVKITPKGSGKINLDGIKYPNADGTTGQFLKTDGSGSLSFATVPAPSTYGNSNVLTLFSAAGSAPVFACRAWVNFNGTGTVAIRDSGNVTSITDNATGNYTVNFSTAIEDANYCALITSGSAGSYSVTNPDFIAKASTYAVGSVTVRIAGASGGTRDENAVNVAIFR